MWNTLSTNQAFLEGFWGGFFEMIALAIVAFWVNIVYQRFRGKQKRKQDLIDEIDAFSYALYKPRKMYQALLDHPEMLQSIPNESDREIQRTLFLQQYLAEMTEAAGRFRSLQVQLVPLFGFDKELFAYYLAIWRYLRTMRKKKMEKQESLYFHHETAQSSDAFYRLIDAFRYHIQMSKSIKQKPSLLAPPNKILLEMQTQSNRIFESYFQITT
jgi:hypothetical protein